MRRPDGTDLVPPAGFGSAGTFVEPRPLPTDGVYTVFVDPQGAAVGGVRVGVWNVPPDPSYAAIPGGEPVVARTTVPGQNATVTFPGRIGQRVSIGLSAATYPTNMVRITVRRPDGT